MSASAPRRDYCDSLEEAASVPVFYVPDEPKISRLATGERETNDVMEKPAVMYGLSAALAALQWRVWDINVDSTTGKISIKRFGAGV